MRQLPAGDLDSLHLVGQGGFGLIYRGWSKTLSMDIAFKTIHGAHGSNLRRLMNNLKKEGDVMHKANYIYILRILGMYETQEGNFKECGLVIEYMPYGSLRSLFDNICEVPWALTFQILHQVCLGMNYLHSLYPPIIHRDLKPANVLLNKHLDIQITDFGLSKIIGATSTAVQPCFAGTLSYMAPEALTDLNYKPTKAYDVYSFGILIWTLFSREEPYNGSNPLLIQQKVPDGQRPMDTVLDELTTVKMVSEAKELMIKCWSGKPEDRPCFRECSGTTRLMFEEYMGEIDSAVRIVQDQLKMVYSTDETTEFSKESTSFSASSFRRALYENESTQQLAQETSDKELAIPDENNTIPEKNESEEEQLSATMAVALTSAVKESGEYKKIVNNLSEQGIVTEALRKNLDESHSIKELGQAAEKILRGKSKELMKDSSHRVKSWFKKI
ncbi:receptor-interacting serine/threonine-protein kinase 3 [Bombina bombina]|uniref:receptor-interacting serine/threonine-protein kinase 3 n=1 Tax=Bombina bombina TaxID=8345 RepID=UPI00235AFB3D|nr:receptor-interacting serine/threonine-protein kinase 3 [Bombina bombina]